MPSKPAQAGYASVNGLKMFYEICGAGKPLVLMHGGVGASEMFGPVLPALAGHRKVIAVHLQAHGRTADIDRPLRYELMAEDLAALLSQIGIARADFIGYSLGGGVALRTAIQHPEVVRRLVLISTVFKRDGWYPEVQTAFAQMGPQTAQGMERSPLSKLYPGVDWGMLFTKIHELQTADYDWSGEVAALEAPTMLVYADADSIRPAHIMEFFGLLGGGQKDAGLDGSGRPTAQLAILPGLTHYNIVSSSALTMVMLPFLDAPMPKAK